ncbi:lipid-A-disaccharide synthase N-terminal domain-containing protein [Cohnella sp. GCM10027633]|uniref:lipid-A-disaccharide synthase N-terminal domain-containing protein n=1 Tax=unclassified Cohnella TaxID=2636738 RepID=UPI003645A9B9
MSTVEIVWVSIGMLGQVLFSLRFIVQWLASEKAHQTVIPYSFWLLSIAGSVILSAYAIYRKDPVFILGQTPSVFIYVRNIMLQKGADQRSRQGTAGEQRDMQEAKAEA